MRETLGPGAVVGILGGGQLGRMLALAAARLGHKCHIYCPDPDSPAFDVAAAHTVAAYDDRAALDRFAAAVDVVTYEFESVPAETATRLAEVRPVRPSPEALGLTQDRLREKSFVSGRGIAVSPFAEVSSEDQIGPAVEAVGTPAVLKTCRFGYDGKGQARIATLGEAGVAWQALGRVPAILEAFVPFEKEVSIVAARGLDGQFVAYDLVENEHENHILRRSVVPAAVPPRLDEAARWIAQEIGDGLGFVGVFCVEMFVMEDRLLVNEIAPRVHNSGHWTLDACLVSQFEQHVRAICGWPLGPTARHSGAEMLNLLGKEALDWLRLAAEPAALHLYGKAKARPGRKMGHLTRLRPRSGA
jgi:5-(carboxyamino)imidazole ribonucleotide synthase